MEPKIKLPPSEFFTKVMPHCEACKKPFEVGPNEVFTLVDNETGEFTFYCLGCLPDEIMATIQTDKVVQ